MPGSGNNGTVRTLVTACSGRSGDFYQRYVSGLYRQALLTLGERRWLCVLSLTSSPMSARWRRRGGAAKATYATAWPSRYSGAASAALHKEVAIVFEIASIREWRGHDVVTEDG